VEITKCSRTLDKKKPMQTPEILTQLVATGMESGNFNNLIKALSNKYLLHKVSLGKLKGIKNEGVRL
jgi:hypothetical protein